MSRYSVLFIQVPGERRKKRNVCGVLMYQLMLLINYVNIVIYVLI